MKYDKIYIPDEEGDYYSTRFGSSAVTTGTRIDPRFNVHVFTEDELKERDKKIISDFIERERKGAKQSDEKNIDVTMQGQKVNL